MIALLLAAAIAQPQPSRAAARQEPAGATAFDSTTQQVRAVGRAVGDVKSALDVFRRDVFNSPDGDVLATAAGFQQSCHALDLAAVLAARKICRHCGSPEVQRALRGFRAVLPSLARMGVRCGARFKRALAVQPQHEAAASLRRDARVIGNEVMAALVPYEQRLQVLRVAAGWAPAPTAGAGRR